MVFPQMFLMRAMCSITATAARERVERAYMSLGQDELRKIASSKKLLSSSVNSATKHMYFALRITSKRILLQKRIKILPPSIGCL